MISMMLLRWSVAASSLIMLQLMHLRSCTSEFFDHAPASSSIMHKHMVLLPLEKRNRKSCRHERPNKDFWITLVYHQSVLLIEYGNGGIYDQQVTGAAHLISVTPEDSFITKEIVLISTTPVDSSTTKATDLRNWDGVGWFGRCVGAIDTSWLD